LKTKADPAGLSKARAGATRTLSSKLKRSEKRVLRLFRRIPKERRFESDIKANAIVYDYPLTGDDLELLLQEIEIILNDELLESQFEMPDDWYWQDTIERPYRRGTLEEVNETNRLIALAIAAGIVLRPKQGQVGFDGLPSSISQVTKIDPQAVLLSGQYQQALGKVYATNFGNIKSLSNNTATQVYGVINRGIDAKLTPNKIAEQISERFNVSKSSAKRIANTEVNKAYTDAKMDMSDRVKEQVGIKSGVLHISALSSTTRAHHAARHGNIYTTTAQREWWDTGSNRINCKCTIKTVLVDRSGNVIDTESQEQIKAERVFFD
jgi:SPP1 gp7 family putative phage head morphogenesis protein